MIPIRETAAGAVFRIRVVPRASRCEAAGIRDDALKLRITAPPVEGKANEECIRLLAELLGVKKTQVTIIAGHASRTKTVAVSGRTAGEIAARLPAFL
ncbi:MAG: YggU family protein [Proteobacteria bacterium]|nr:YggU family protein [Pseudomonadota bacterium]MBU2261219.1 YggU family protein [Pseudomonadota bacterium]